ncbi:peptidylprolyl isomerase [Cytobacillus praedii]|uniref:peptidylprolyl isomerase n=1 Tax=Cytobacillus praedii TaxID=1742358 RepID=UPI002E245764|nr:peptidylprolyl isomerase [Cytobacillus praedii]
MLSRYKSLAFVLTVLLVLFSLAGCGAQAENGISKDSNAGKSGNKASEKSEYPSDVTENPVVTITMENNEVIKLELYPDIAPNTVANFVTLINKGFYDGLIFHRVIPDFMIQGGDPAGNGTGGPDYSIFGEFAANGFENNLKHERGVLSMARTSDPNSAGSQFFIMVNETTQLDGQYAAFGKVIEGMEVVDSIVSVERNGSDLPLKEQKMKTVKVDTKGYSYPEPEVQ